MQTRLLWRVNKACFQAGVNPLEINGFAVPISSVRPLRCRRRVCCMTPSAAVLPLFAAKRVCKSRFAEQWAWGCIYPQLRRFTACSGFRIEVPLCGTLWVRACLRCSSGLACRSRLSRTSLGSGLAAGQASAHTAPNPSQPLKNEKTGRSI